MIEWKAMADEKPVKADKMYLVQETGGRIVQAYWSGTEWAVAWGCVYTDQPKVWAELNFPRL